MDNVSALFNEADTNRDGFLTQDEFRNFVTRNSTAGLETSSFTVNDGYNNLGNGNSYDSSLFQSSINSSNIESDQFYNGATFERMNSNSSLYRPPVGNITDSLANINLTSTEQLAGADATYATSSAASQVSSVQQYETDADGNFKDSNPQIIRRPSRNGPMTYKQNIQVRFLRPPAVPPPGPLIIKEVRPPQPPLPAPLRIRQQAPPLPQQPALILRERPPPKPSTVASQTVTRTLPAIPVPPRSVIIERVPPLPAKPRDIVIERWLPYGAMAKRKTIVQRAEAIKPYPKPRNTIIEYEVPQIRVVRQFQRLGITSENPEQYIQRYGTSLVDTQTLLQQARAAGVVEDISVPDVSSSNARITSEVSSPSSISGVSFETNNINGADVRNVIRGGGSGGGGGDGNRSSFYESSSYSTTGDIAGSPASLGDFRSLSNESYSYGSSTGGITDRASAIFSAADTNNDGVLSIAEFRNAGF